MRRKDKDCSSNEEFAAAVAAIKKLRLDLLQIICSANFYIISF
jgi:hypothetical protein